MEHLRIFCLQDVDIFIFLNGRRLFENNVFKKPAGMGFFKKKIKWPKVVDFWKNIP